MAAGRKASLWICVLLLAGGCPEFPAYLLHPDQGADGRRDVAVDRALDHDAARPDTDDASRLDRPDGNRLDARLDGSKVDARRDVKPDLPAVDQKPAPDYGPCPPVCANGCSKGVCEISSCVSGCTCPAGYDCRVTCSGSCGVIDCSKAQTCDIICGAFPGCTQKITCGSGMCTVLCGKGPCPDVDCHTSCGCSVACGSVGCVGIVTCPSKCSSCLFPASPCTCP